MSINTLLSGSFEAGIRSIEQLIEYYVYENKEDTFYQQLFEKVQFQKAENLNNLIHLQLILDQKRSEHSLLAIGSTEFEHFRELLKERFIKEGNNIFCQNLALTYLIDMDFS